MFCAIMGTCMNPDLNFDFPDANEVRKIMNLVSKVH